MEIDQTLLDAVGPPYLTATYIAYLITSNAGKSPRRARVISKLIVLQDLPLPLYICSSGTTTKSRLAGLGPSRATCESCSNSRPTNSGRTRKHRKRDWLEKKLIRIWILTISLCSATCIQKRPWYVFGILHGNVLTNNFSKVVVGRCRSYLVDCWSSMSLWHEIDTSL